MKSRSSYWTWLFAFLLLLSPELLIAGATNLELIRATVGSAIDNALKQSPAIIQRTIAIEVKKIPLAITDEAVWVVNNVLVDKLQQSDFTVSVSKSDSIPFFNLEVVELSLKGELFTAGFLKLGKQIIRRTASFNGILKLIGSEDQILWSFPLEASQTDSIDADEMQNLNSNLVFAHIESVEKNTKPIETITVAAVVTTLIILFFQTK